MRNYKCLNNTALNNGAFSLVPIRDEDKLAILKMRNEQIYHLRQAEPLTVEMQEAYFENIVSKLFEQEKPNQILFSLLENGKFVGYGGLVHINWIDKNAEISFVMKTELEKEKFSYYWENYLKVLEDVAFNDLKLHKIFTYAFDLRPHLYPALEASGFHEEARLKEHCYFEGRYLDVLIHSKINKYELRFREVFAEDVNVLFNWANDDDVRQNAINKTKILFEDHQKWFESKLISDKCKIYIFYFGNDTIGQIRLDKSEEFWVIDYSIDKIFRGRGLGAKMLELILNQFPNDNFKALVKDVNIPSCKAFEKVGFEKVETTIITGEIINVYKKYSS